MNSNFEKLLAVRFDLMKIQFRKVPLWKFALVKLDLLFDNFQKLDSKTHIFEVLHL